MQLIRKCQERFFSEHILSGRVTAQRNSNVQTHMRPTQHSVKGGAELGLEEQIKNEGLESSVGCFEAKQQARKSCKTAS